MLKLDDIKEFFALIGIEFIEKDFLTNQNPSENSEINEENKMKKLEQNRRKKEKKQKKKSEKINSENKNSNESKLEDDSKSAKINDEKIEINSIIHSQENTKKRKIGEENHKDNNGKMEEIINKGENKYEISIEYNAKDAKNQNENEKSDEIHPENLKTQKNFKKILKSKNLNNEKLITTKIGNDFMKNEEEYLENNDNNKSIDQNFEKDKNGINLLNNSGILEGINEKQELSKQNDANLEKWNNFAKELANIHSIKGG